MSTKSFTTTCPSCGNVIDVTISEHECKTAVKRGATKVSAEDRLKLLKESGVNVANFFAMRGSSGENMLVRLQDGKLTQVNDDDPIFVAIRQGGAINNSTLYRRWVMSQMFHMLRKTRWNDGNFHENLKRKGYEYMWKMTVEEFRVQARLFKNDKENYAARNLWFNRELAISMCEQYIYDIRKYFRSLTPRKCKGVPYKTIHNTNIFVKDFESKVVVPLGRYLRELRLATTPQGVYEALYQFNSRRYTLSYSTPQYKMWQNAYKGVGAYYTMKSLILFYGCKFYTDSHEVGFSSQKGDLLALDIKAQTSRDEGWRMLAALQKMIADNGIDIDKTIKSWQK